MPDNQPLDISRLVVEHHAALYRYAFRLAGSVPDAEDLTQETLLAAHSKLDQVRDPVHVRSWLFSILRNCYLKQCRKWRPVPAGTLDSVLASVPDSQSDDAPIDSERLQAALDELPPEFKVVLMLFYFEDASYRQIAEQLELPMGTVMSRLSRAKRHLRARLFEPCHTAARHGLASQG